MKPHNIIKNVETINEIIAIETAAQELVKKAELEQAELQSTITALLEAYETKKREKALKKINNIRNAEEKSAKDKISRIQKDHKSKLSRLEKITVENMDIWVARIYASMIEPTQI